MVPRRPRRWLIFLGVILIVVGLFAIVYGTSPASVNETDPIPAGWTNFNEFSWSVLAGGTLQGTFQAVNGTPVNVIVLNDADYSSFVNGANLTGLYNVTSTSGTISLSVSGFNTYHVVFQHGAGYENTTQYVSVDLTATGADPTFTLGGALALVVAAVLILYYVRKSRQPAGPAGTLPSRATIGVPPMPPSGPDMGTSGTGVYRVPPPLPGDAENPPATVVSPTAAPPANLTTNPVGTLQVTLQNPSGADATVDLVVNGVAVTSMTIPAGQSAQTSVSARLSSPFGSTVTVEAVLAGGRRVRQAVFVGAGGTAPVMLRLA